MAVGDIYRITIRGKYDEQLCVNVFHWRHVTEGTDPPSALGLAAQFETKWTTVMLPQLSMNYTLQGVDCQKVLPELGAIYTSPADPPEAGSLVGDSLPGTVASVITLRTALGGKSYRGRSYICAPPENLTTIGKLNTAYRIALGTAFGTFRAEHTDVTGNKFRLGILSLRSTTVPAGTFTEVVDHITQEIMGNMRSRRIGRGT